MHKIRLIFILLFCFVLLSSCAVCSDKAKSSDEEIVVESKHIRAMWLSCYELQPMLSKGTLDCFENEIISLFEICEQNALNTLFVQVRPFCDALYPSEIFEWSKFALSSSGDAPKFDPLEIIVSIAKEYDVSVHAWINPYRISYDPEKKISEKVENFSFSCDKGIYLDPSNVEAQKMVLDGAREILEKYDVGGIHIDDYFYPLTSEDFDEIAYKKYIESGGKLSKNQWRCENVNSLVSSLCSLVHSIKPDAIFSISPAGDIRNNSNSHYADVELWLTQSGYADWVVPQIYFGFEHETMPFENTAKEWYKLHKNSNVKLICGLASYKKNKVDIGAGNGKNEWINSDDIIDKQIECIQHLGYDGYSLFSYSSVK